MILTHPLTSSMIESAQYDTDLQKLSCKFRGAPGKSGKLYQSTLPVPREVYDCLIGAASAGKYYNFAIKGKYGMVALAEAQGA